LPPWSIPTMGAKLSPGPASTKATSLIHSSSMAIHTTSGKHFDVVVFPICLATACFLRCQLFLIVSQDKLEAGAVIVVGFYLSTVDVDNPLDYGQAYTGVTALPPGEGKKDTVD